MLLIFFARTCGLVQLFNIGHKTKKEAFNHV